MNEMALGFILGILIGLVLVGGAIGLIIYCISRVFRKKLSFISCFGIGTIISLISFLLF